MNKLTKQFLAVALSASMLATVGAYASAAEAGDLPATGHWARAALESGLDNGLLKLDAANRVNPTKPLARGDIAGIINRAFAAAQTADLSMYSDIATSDEFYLDMAKAVKMGTFKGSGSQLKANQLVSRQEAFAVLARALQIPSADVSLLSRFVDADTIEPTLRAECAGMVAAGYITGDQANRFNPNDTVTCEQFAAVVYRAVQTYVTGTEPVTTLADGSVMVNVPDATLQGVTVKGDLIVGDGVGAGDFTMDAVTVEGRLVIRGGGANSIKIQNGSKVANVVINKPSDGGVRIVSDDSSAVTTVAVAGGASSVIVDGKVETLNITGAASVEIKGTVTKVEIQEAATNAKVDVAKGATVKEMVSSAPSVEVKGDGKIETATVSGDGTKFDVKDTNLTVSDNTANVTNNGKDVSTSTGGTTGGTTGGGTTTSPSGGGSTGGGGGGSGSIPTKNFKPQIDNLMKDSMNLAVSLMNDGASTSASATMSGNIISFTGVSNSFLVGDALEKIKTDDAAGLMKLAIDAFDFVKTITIDGETLTLSNRLTFDEVKTFMKAAFPVATTESITDLNGTTVTIASRDNNTYTYTINVTAPSA